MQIATRDISPWQDAVSQERRMLGQIMNSVSGIMKPMGFRNFPNDYLAIDVETTGVRFHDTSRGVKHWDGDFITELGYCYVHDGVPEEPQTLVLNWAAVPTISRKALNERMEFTRQQMEWKDGKETGKKYHMSLERMEREGSDPIAVLKEFADICKLVREQKVFFLAHNGLNFDARMFESHFKFWVGSDFTFGDNEMFDTGMVEKASRSCNPPWPGDTIRSWSHRVYTQRLKGVKWSLDRDCVPRYGLKAKYNLDMDKAHSAGFDAYVTTRLFEEFKKVAAGAEEPPVFAP